MLKAGKRRGKRNCRRISCSCRQGAAHERQVKESRPYPKDSGGATGASAVSGIIRYVLTTGSGYSAENGLMKMAVGTLSYRRNPSQGNGGLTQEAEITGLDN